MNIYTSNTVYQNYLNGWTQTTSSRDDSYDAMRYFYEAYNKELKATWGLQPKTVEPEEIIEPTPVPTFEEKRKLLKELI